MPWQSKRVGSPDRASPSTMDSPYSENASQALPLDAQDASVSGHHLSSTVGNGMSDREASVPIHHSVTAFLRREPWLAGAIVVSVLVIIYQLTISLLQPPWLSAATDWGRSIMGWFELIPVTLAGMKLYHDRHPEALSWLFFAAAMLSFAIGQTTWAALNQVIVPGHAPVPSLADLFYLLQYPFFFLALTLLPGSLRLGQPGIVRVKVVLDSLLLMAAGTAVSWYFILEPFYSQSAEGYWGKVTNLAYPVGDLGLLFGLAVIITSRRQHYEGRVALRLFIAAVVALIFADSFFLYGELYTNYSSGGLPDVFWMTCYLIFALAGLVRLRTGHMQVSHARPSYSYRNTTQPRRGGSISAFLASSRLFIPFLAAVLSSLLLVFHSVIVTAQAHEKYPLLPFIVSFGLLVLVCVRQGLTMLENEQLLQVEQRRAEELTLANQLAQKQQGLLDERNQRLEEQAVQIEKAYEQQLQLNELKDQFLLNVNHELRTPLTEIYGYLDLLSNHNQQIDPSIQTMFLEHALRGCEELQGLVNNVLNAIQGDFLGRSPQLENIQVAAAVHQALTIFEGHKQQLYQITVDVSPALMVQADRQYLQQVLLNLLSNAFKYSPPHTQVTVHATLQPASQCDSSQTEHAREVCICVEDKGLGIPPDDIPLLFGKFVRLQRDLIGSVRGSGLGLYISKQFVEAMGGQIWVESSGVSGEGSRFYFTLAAAS